MYDSEGRPDQLCPPLNALALNSPLSLFPSQNINPFGNRMLMLDGMPAVRVKTELLESEQGVSKQELLTSPRPRLFLTVALLPEHPEAGRIVPWPQLDSPE